MTYDLQGRALLAWEQLLARPETALVAFDFDGTLSPITDDPDSAYAHPEVGAVLGRVGPRVAQLAVVTGRPVRTVVELGGFEGADGLGNLVVLGQYGVERWDATTGRHTEPPPPDGIAAVREELPVLLAEAGLAGAHIEEKGRALGVHVRRLPDPQGAYERLVGPLEDLAARHRMVVELGRQIIEIRAQGMDKGAALRSLVDEVGARCVVFGGDDLGDIPAFDMVAQLRDDGTGRTGLRICSASGEQGQMAGHADLVVDGPDGLVAFLDDLASRLGA
ncbi:MAG: trehalose-phosphatase [Actinomycetota bacterium]|nr:trehalose-phosphatase [Actinomycetota bacterium]